MRPFAVHEHEIKLLRKLRALPARERKLAYAVIEELASGGSDFAASLPANVLKLVPSKADRSGKT